MHVVSELVGQILDLRRSREVQTTLLAVCPNSAAVVEAAVKVAARTGAPMLFAATLNQVDRDGGYTGWTPASFVQEMERCRLKCACASPLYPCLDHGGPWLKDRHTQLGLSLEETTAEVKASLSACIAAGYSLLHIDTTVDRRLPAGEPVPIKGVVDRTWELISYCEAERQRLGVGHISYEVGTEEVHGGLADIARFQNFVAGLHERLNRNGLNSAWPCFIVGKVGTDLHTTDFDPQMAHVLYEIVAPLGSLIKGHYSDWVSNPEAYPVHGVGGANVGPEFTSVELAALEELTAREADMARGRPGLQRSDFMAALSQAVVDSGRWRKWLQPGEQALPFDDLAPARRRWLVSTGARYVWTAEPVQEARRRLYDNLAAVMPDPASFVIDRIAQAIEHYITAFRLFDILTLIGDAPAADTRARV